LAAVLLLLPPTQINPRFYRTHLLTALGLTGLATVFLADQASLMLWSFLGLAMLLTLAGGMAWLLEGAPGGRGLILLSVPVLVGSLILASRIVWPAQPLGMLLADDLTSAGLLGAATTAMLVGHSYLIVPTMALTPLVRSLAALGACGLLRLGLALAGLWLWRAGAAADSIESGTILWLAVRWGVGLLAPLVLGWMAWETTRIRSTQSATGILYVVVIFCFLGELTSQLLLSETGYVL
jgi:hypothetical protein